MHRSGPPGRPASPADAHKPPTVISENENGTDRGSAARGMANFDPLSLPPSRHEAEKKNGEHSEKQVLFYVTVIEGAPLANAARHLDVFSRIRQWMAATLLTADRHLSRNHVSRNVVEARAT